jgi:hypothetical protein
MRCSGLRRQNSAYKYRYRMGSWRTARIRRALGSSIPPKTARIICESTSLQALWPLLRESLCNPSILRSRLQPPASRCHSGFSRCCQACPRSHNGSWLLPFSNRATTKRRGLGTKACGDWVRTTIAPERENHVKGQACLICKRNSFCPLPYNAWSPKGFLMRRSMLRFSVWSMPTSAMPAGARSLRRAVSAAYGESTWRALSTMATVAGCLGCRSVVMAYTRC